MSKFSNCTPAATLDYTFPAATFTSASTCAIVYSTDFFVFPGGGGMMRRLQGGAGVEISVDSPNKKISFSSTTLGSTSFNLIATVMDPDGNGHVITKAMTLTVTATDCSLAAFSTVQS
jgi:hypothetical protein